jgi:hypothetical protein
LTAATTVEHRDPSAGPVLAEAYLTTLVRHADDDQADTGP